MLQHQISSLLITREGQLIGIVTEHDLFRMIPSYQTIPSTTVQNIMSTNLVTLPSESYFYEAMLKMINHKIKHLPVVTGEKPAILNGGNPLVIGRIHFIVGFPIYK